MTRLTSLGPQPTITRVTPLHSHCLLPPSHWAQETSCPSECFTLESGGSVWSSKASELENPSVFIQSLDSAASPSQSTIKIYTPWLFKLNIRKQKVNFKLHFIHNPSIMQILIKVHLKITWSTVILWHRFLSMVLALHINDAGMKCWAKLKLVCLSIEK